MYEETIEVEEQGDLLPPEEIDQDDEDEEDLGSEKTPQESDITALYLRNIGGVPLLTREQEVELAKAEEAGEAQVAEAALSSPVALRHVLELGDKVKRAELSLGDILLEMDEEDGPGNPNPHRSDDTIQRERFLKQIGKPRGLSRDPDLLHRELRKEKLSSQRRARLKENLERKTRAAFRITKELGLSKSRVNEIAGKLKTSCARITELVRELESAVVEQGQGSIRREIRRIEAETGLFWQPTE